MNILEHSNCSCECCSFSLSLTYLTLLQGQLITNFIGVGLHPLRVNDREDDGNEDDDREDNDDEDDD